MSRATECAPEDGRLWLELEEIWAWLGRRDSMERAWERALALLPGQELPQAWCRRGRQLRAVVCHPEASFAAYRTAEAPLTRQSSAAVRADTLIGLAWGEAQRPASRITQRPASRITQRPASRITRPGGDAFGVWQPCGKPMPRLMVPRWPRSCSTVRAQWPDGSLWQRQRSRSYSAWSYGGAMAGGSHGPVVKSRRSASSLVRLHLAAVDR